MTAHHIRVLRVFILTIIGIVLVSFGLILRAREHPIQGVVTSDGNPIVNAVVRLQGDSAYVLSDAQGHFLLPVTNTEIPFHITAWAPGYYITAAATDGIDDVQLVMRRHPTDDNPDYTFISPVLEPDNPTACGRCHAARTGMANIMLPVDEWLKDAHASSAVNPRFLSVYNGTTLDGEKGLLTAYYFDAAAGINIPTEPSQGQDKVGVGFRLDFPDEAGSCAACHVPVSALSTLDLRDPNQAEGIAQEGITCDFCHKVWDVHLEADGKPSPHRPGVQSLQFLRPTPGEQVFLGPLDDTPGDDIYLPLQNKSQFCAACHSGSFWGVGIYDSFGEWLKSAYNNSETGKTCQDCHMPHRGADQFVQLPPDVSQYVPQRDPQTIFSHLMPGATDATLLQETAELQIETQWQADSLKITAGVTNTGAGHDIPTDNPLRNIILLVTANNASGEPLTLSNGPTIPVWGGVGDMATGHYAGQPGVLFAKILADYYTGETPTYAYWRQTRLISDNRIPALATDTSIYEFQVPNGVNTITVEARLYLRRAFINLMDLKGWNMPDILMEQAVMNLER